MEIPPRRYLAMAIDDDDVFAARMLDAQVAGGAGETFRIFEHANHGVAAGIFAGHLRRAIGGLPVNDEDL